MTKLKNIRRRLVLAAFTLATTVAVIFAGGLHYAFDTAEDKLFDDHVIADVNYFVAAYDNDPGIIDIPRRNFDVHIADGDDRSTLPSYLQGLAPDEDEVIRDGKEFELIVRTSGTKTLYFMFDESEMEEFENALMFAMFTLIILVIGGSAWAGHIVADRIIQPLTKLSREVSEMGIGDNADIEIDPESGSDDEITTLAVAINGYHARISELLRREREFSADVSHELRTPIMAVQGATELLAKRLGPDDKIDELLTRIKRGCFHMTTLTEALLFLARDPKSFEDMVEPVSVRRVIEAQIAAVQDVVQKKGIKVNVEGTSPDTTVNTIPAVIEIVIGNILKNAVKYTNQNVINIFVENDEIVIQDYGPGIDRTVQAALFDRFNRGKHRDSDGSGIGLALVRRFCEQYGWVIDFRSDQDSGTRVAVAF
jgi:signal transduction histidine kinase